MAIIPGLENVNLFSVFGEVMQWTGILLISVAILSVIATVYYVIGFRIKATEFRLYGSAKDGAYSIGMPKKNRYKWIKNRTAWRPLLPFFNKKEIEPFESEYVYPGNRIWTIIINDTLIPCKINVSKSSGEFAAEIKPVPLSIRNWQSLMHKKHAIEYAKQGFWEDNKQLLITMGTVMFCLILCGATIWMAYKFSSAGVASADKFTDFLKNYATIPGK